jgi:hypothetical protein
MNFKKRLKRRLHTSLGLHFNNENDELSTDRLIFHAEYVYDSNLKKVINRNIHLHPFRYDFFTYLVKMIFYHSKLKIIVYKGYRLFMLKWCDDYAFYIPLGTRNIAKRTHLTLTKHDILFLISTYYMGE